MAKKTEVRKPRLTGRSRQTEPGGEGPREYQIELEDGRKVYAEEGSMLFDEAKAVSS